MYDDLGHHTPVVQIHHRYGMTLFIASEVMFFVAWFWAYFDISLFPNEFVGNVWPPKDIETFDPWVKCFYIFWWPNISNKFIRK